MLRAWRERDQDKRIKTAHQALEYNSRYVLCRKPVFQSLVLTIVFVVSLIKFLHHYFDSQDGKDEIKYHYTEFMLSDEKAFDVG